MNTYSYVYNYTDHLGNIRLRYTSTDLGNGIQKLEENHYYPFGLKHKKYNSYQYVFVALNEIDGYDLGIDPLPERGRDEYQYKYNGKEFQDELGLNFYDYYARNYDPALGRWMNIDPLAELSRRYSPYTYCYDSPLRYIDPDGMLAESVIDDILKKSGSGETKWTFNQDGSISGSNGEVIDAEEEHGDKPKFGDKPKEPTSKIGKFFNKIGNKIDKQKQVIANNLANDYERNDRLIMAYSFVMEALLETTEAGELLSYIRESMADTYGNEKSKEANEVYSNVISIVKQIKESVGGGKLSDAYVYKASAAFGAKAITLQIKNEAIALTIKGLDENVYYNRRIDPSQERDGGGFGGGGAKHEY